MADVGQQEQPGGEPGTLSRLLSHLVSHCQFMFQTLQQLVRMVLYLGCKGQRAVGSKHEKVTNNANDIYKNILTVRKFSNKNTKKSG